VQRGSGWRGGNADHIGLVSLDESRQLAGRGRHRNGLHQAAAGRQDLRQHHTGDCIPVVAGGEAEDADL
jgi:hypothetical protein